MKRLATLFLLVILAAAAGFVAPRPASACSCAQLDPAFGLAEYPAAFVGTLVNVDRGIGIGGISLGGDIPEAVYRFKVEEWVKGDLGDFVDVHSAADGGACGIEVGVGNRAGVFLNVQDGQLNSDLCSVIDADVLLAGAEPLVVGAPGPGILLASGNIGGYNYVVLNQEGGIVAGINGPFHEPFEQPWQFSVCPGGDVLVEQWSRGLVVRDLSDLSVIRQIDLGDFANNTSFSAMRCSSRDGSEIIMSGEVWNRDKPDNNLYRVTDAIEAVAELPPGQVWLGNNLAVISDYNIGTVSIFEFASGEATTIHEIAEKGNSDYIASVGISPDGGNVVLAEIRYDDSAGTETNLFVYGDSGESLATKDLAGEVWWIQWLDEGRLVVNGYSDESGATSALILTPQLDVLLEIDEWQGSNPAVLNEKIYGVSGGTIVSADLSDGSAWPLVTLPTQFLGSIVALPADFNPSPDVLTGDPDINPPATVPPLISDQFGVEEAVDVTSTARIVIAVLLFGGIVAFVLTRGKTRNAD